MTAIKTVKSSTTSGKGTIMELNPEQEPNLVNYQSQKEYWTQRISDLALAMEYAQAQLDKLEAPEEVI
jgi:hypothetical protein